MTLLLLLAATVDTWAQLGGRAGYSFLGVAPTARSAALGGFIPQNTEEDAAGMLYNPAGAATPGIASLSYNPYAGRFRYSMLAGMKDAFGGTAGASLQYLDFGTIDAYTPGGDPMGTYTANAYAVNLNYSRALGPFRFGANLKLAGSSIEAYNTFGMGVDLGATYQHPNKQFSAGLVVQNVGGTLKTFQGTTSRNWPFSVSGGASYKFAHMPLRFYATAQQLQQWDIVYLDPTYSVKTNADGSTEAETKPWSEKLFRHGAIGAELYIGKVILVRGGYNHLLRKEMRIATTSAGSAGYSMGIGLKLKRLTFDYTHMFVAAAGGANYLSLAYRFGTDPAPVAVPQ